MSRAGRIEEAARELARYARSYGQYHLDKFYDGEIGVNAGVRRLWDCADAVDAALAAPAQPTCEACGHAETDHRDGHCHFIGCGRVCGGKP